MSPSIARKVLGSFSKKEKKSFEKLTKQQTTILELIAEGFLNKEIAARLGISERTVRHKKFYFSIDRYCNK